MSEVYAGWVRTRVPDGYTPPAELLRFARKAMGALLADVKAGQLGVATRRHDLLDGSRVTVSWDGTTPVMDIHPAPDDAPIDNSALFDLWVPRGFVVYPAWADAPAGVGLPIIADSQAGPYDKVNLAPGLDRTRWTAGGVCGEVLISPDLDAGYPLDRQAVPVPLLYHPTLGPVLHWPGKGTLDGRATKAWHAYRIELDAPVPHYPDESQADMRTLFEAINSYRVGSGLAALNLPPRGLYHPAHVMCSIMQAAGRTDATSTSYPATYTTVAARLTKDGYAGLLVSDVYPNWTRDGAVRAGEVRALGGAADAVTTWDADPTDAAVLRRATATALDTGARGGYLAASVIDRDRWLQAGNQNWQSSDPDLPPLSWMGFASLNLAWETFPAQYDPGSASQPLIPAAAFTDANGDCWLNYPRRANATAAEQEPAMSRHVFCRGRAIAVAPRGGLVWAAGLLPVGAVDRLIALVHHPEDQGDPVSAGRTRYLRVWWADLPRRAALRADPQEVIAGEDTTDPWGWRGGQLVDVGQLPDPSQGFVATASPNSLKYASQWRFAPDGSRAVCLRDYGAQADYVPTTIGNLTSLETSFSRAVELVFAATETDLSTSVVAHEYTAGPLAAPKQLVSGVPPLSNDHLTTAGAPAELFDAGCYPLAVDYAADGALLYAYSVTLFTSAYADRDTGFAQQLLYSYAGVGPASATYLDDLTDTMLHGANFKTPGQAFEPFGLLVADVRSGAFIGAGLAPRYALDTSDLHGGATVLTTPTNPPCSPYTSESVNGVRVARQGAALGETWYPNPDGALWFPMARCQQSGDGAQVYLPRAVSANIQAFYATRFGEYILSYQVSPMPRAVLVAETVPTDPICGCQLTQNELAGNLAMHWLGANEVAPRGGGVFASVTLPSRDWLIYAKVV